MANTNKTVKKETKKKLPEVKQTLTSVYRMVKANPMLVYQNNKKQGDNFKFGDVVIPDSVTYLGSKRDTLDRALDKKNTSLFPSYNNVSSKCSTSKLKNDTLNHDKNDTSKLVTLNASQLKIPVRSNVNKINIKPAPTRFVSTQQKIAPSRNASMLKTVADKKLSTRTVLAPVCAKKTNSIDKTNNKIGVSSSSIRNNFAKRNMQGGATVKETKESFKIPTVKLSRAKCISKIKPRRSLSAEHYDRKHCLKAPKQEQHIINSEITQSMENIPQDLSSIAENISEITKSVKKTVTFRTPTSNKRNTSLFSTPGNNSIMHTSTPAHNKPDLHRRLNEWLKKRGKSINSFHHLKCFGVHGPKKTESAAFEDDENKENIEGPIDLAHGNSYEDLKIVLVPPKLDEIVITPKEDEQHFPLAKEALGDLHKLIIEGYSVGQCEAWLANIRQKYRLIEDEPQYWECRAAIEQTRGNLTSAVECYKTAIVKGAEVKQVDESLDHLLQKFSLLNISTSAENMEGHDKRAKNINEARNIFKSSIIQFAVQERALKSKEIETKKFRATPVRRSTRLSRSVYVSTPGIKICNSLHELDKSIQNELSFQTNSFLS